MGSYQEPSEKNNTFNGTKELYNDKNIITSTDGVKQIIDNYINSEFLTNEENDADITNTIKQIDGNTPVE